MNLIGHHQLATTDGFSLAEGPHLFGKSPNELKIANYPFPLLRKLEENSLKSQVKDVCYKCAQLLESSIPMEGITNNGSVVLILFIIALITAHSRACRLFL